MKEKTFSKDVLVSIGQGKITIRLLSKSNLRYFHIHILLIHRRWASALRKLTPASTILASILYFQSVPAPNMPTYGWLVWYRTCSGIVSFFHSGIGLTGCRTVQHNCIYIYTYTYTYTYTYKYTYTYTYTHTYTCTYTYTYPYTYTYEGRNPDKKLSPLSLLFRQFSLVSQ